MGIVKKIDEIERILKEILGRYDLSKPEGRNEAYEECIEFAETRLGDDLRCNTFLRMAAQMLEKHPVEFDIIRDLVEIPDNAKLDIAYDDQQGFVLTANASGIDYLIELLHMLAEAPEEEHIHLFNDEEPLTSISFNAVIYHEGEEWFQNAEREVSEETAKNPVRKRAIQPEEIFAVQIVGSLPEDISILRDRIYRVDRVIDNMPDYEDDELADEKTWRKACAGEEERYVCIEVTDDYGEDLTLILHLDDPDIIYFKRGDVEHLFG